MNKKQRILYWEAVIKAIIADHKALDKACNNAMKAGTLEANGALYTAIWKSFDGLLGHLDKAGWLSWFIYDNDCGKAGRAARLSSNRRLMPIRTPMQLAKLITEHEGENYGR
jgi:hypothetical protein